ncbi:hypothetical protein EV401DRAFT_925533 [Pisolithus croceorrhizus]|nr:hypothetical protein EV401DRAFT_925533 [Pisolithus croceorrhizus]
MPLLLLTGSLALQCILWCGLIASPISHDGLWRRHSNIDDLGGMVGHGKPYSNPALHLRVQCNSVSEAGENCDPMDRFTWC